MIRSYASILKASSIVGGSQAVSYIIGMVRTKLVAMLPGPTGVGLVALYGSVMELLGTLTGLGVSQSGVREVAEIHGRGQAERFAPIVKALRRACWVTGILGWLLSVALAYPISHWILGSGERAWAIAAHGSTLLLGAIHGGQIAILQGTRRIGDLARMNVLGAIAITVIAVGIYGWLGKMGIVPVNIRSRPGSDGAKPWKRRGVGRLSCVSSRIGSSSLIPQLSLGFTRSL